MQTIRIPNKKILNNKKFLLLKYTPKNAPIAENICVLKALYLLRFCFNKNEKSPTSWGISWKNILIVSVIPSFKSFF